MTNDPTELRELRRGWHSMYLGDVETKQSKARTSLLTLLAFALGFAFGFLLSQ